MTKYVARTLTLALTLALLTAPIYQASAADLSAAATSSQVATGGGVTGGDPEPIEPGIVQRILSFLHLG
jgi:hypothetical protein